MAKRGGYLYMVSWRESMKELIQNDAEGVYCSFNHYVEPVYCTYANDKKMAAIEFLKDRWEDSSSLIFKDFSPFFDVIFDKMVDLIMCGDEMEFIERYENKEKFLQIFDEIYEFIEEIKKNHQNDIDKNERWRFICMDYYFKEVFLKSNEAKVFCKKIMQLLKIDGVRDAYIELMIEDVIILELSDPE